MALAVPRRASGVLLPVSSLPSPYGIGTLGKEARLFIEYLAAAGQQYWQVLPLGPTSYGDSPYQSFSAFAGNPYFIDLDALCTQGLLHRNEFEAIGWGSEPRAVSYRALYQNRESVLRKAFARFENAPALTAFIKENDVWLPAYALFMAIKNANNGRSWVEWDEKIRTSDPTALDAARDRLKQDIRYHQFVQYLFFSQWRALRAFARQHGVEIIGDIPIYVAMDSADVWANKKLFQFADALPPEVAGCPPDSFTAEGQLWGNPLYDWDTMAKDGYAWWMARMRASFDLYDVLRIDHFRGLESYYAIPYGSGDAIHGRWRQGPKMAFVDALRKALPGARVIAEDLGFHTPALREFLLEAGYPGMKVLQFAFDTREPNDYSPYSYKRDDVVYTGTHDNDTVLGWALSAPPSAVSHAMEYTGVHNAKELPRAMIRLALSNQAALTIVPLQDWLGLDGTARMNVPSTVGGRNWRWRAVNGDFTHALAGEMRRLSELYGRV